MVTLSDAAIKRVAALRVLSLREEVESFRDEGRLWKMLTAFVEAKEIASTGPGFAVHYTLGGGGQKIDMEVCVPVADDTHVADDHGIKGLELHTLPAVETAAFVVLQGRCTALPEAYTKMFDWIKINDMKQIGPTRQIYLTRDEDPMCEQYKCEVQAPIS